MKINNITATDYRIFNGGLTLIGLAAATLEEVTGMDVSMIEVRTDEGDLVEALAGYTMRSVTFDVTNGTYTALLSMEAEDTTGAALDAMARGLVEAQDEVRLLQAANNDIMDALVELGDLVAAGAAPAAAGTEGGNI